MPIAAAVLVPGSGLGDFTAATAPITEQAVVAGNTTGSGPDTTIALSAPAGAARVRLTELIAAAAAGAAPARPGGIASQQVTVAGRPHAGGAGVSAARRQRGSAFAVGSPRWPGRDRFTPREWKAQGQSSIVSIIPAVSALTTISFPPVRDS